MKRFVKAILRAAWRATGPIRRPLLRKAHALMVQASAEALARSPLAAEIRTDAAASRDQFLPPIHRHIEQAAETARSTSADLDLVLNGMIREVARLQMQVEALQETIEATSRPLGEDARANAGVRARKFAG